MQRARAYAVAVVTAASQNASCDAVVEGLMDTLKQGGELSLLPKILREVHKELERTSTVHARTLTIARATDEVSARSQLAESGAHADVTIDRVVIDPRIVGGYTLGNANHFADASYRTKLINLFNSLV